MLVGWSKASPKKNHLLYDYHWLPIDIEVIWNHWNMPGIVNRQHQTTTTATTVIIGKRIKESICGSLRFSDSRRSVVWEQALGKYVYNIYIYNLIITTLTSSDTLIDNHHVSLIIYFNWRYALNISLDLVSLDRLRVLPWRPSSQSR